MQRIVLSFLLSLCFSLPTAAIAGNWSDWLAQLRQEALAEGIEPAIFDRAFRGVTPSRKLLHYDRRQPEKRLTFKQYRNTRADAFRIRLGRKEYRRYHNLLKQVEQRYGVDACVVVSLWGMETSYGRYMGSHPVVSSLATLAYDKRRSAFFRKELLLALHILNEGHVTLKDFKGEWAGGSGHPQFLPSSWHNYAVDFNGDGRKDIWHNLSDAFASISNYLVQNGWQNGQPWSAEVTLSSNFDKSLLGYEHQKPLYQWLALGVRSKDPLPDSNTIASVVTPYGGPSYLVFNNFRVFMKYNRSTFYAGTIGYMADSICGDQMTEDRRQKTEAKVSLHELP